MPDFLILPVKLLPWIWGLILLSAALTFVETKMNRLAKEYIPCPHCQKPIKRRQKACHHCLRNR